MRGMFEFVFVVALFTIGLGLAIHTILPGSTKNLFGSVGKAPFPKENIIDEKPEHPAFGKITPDTLGAISGTVLYVDGDYKEEIFNKNAESPLLIASVTKLMTALLVEENLLETATTTVPKTVLAKRGAIKKFTAGSVYDVKTLMDAMLVESNNDAGWILAGMVGSTTDDFVKKMNEKAISVGMVNTSYGNPVGIDPADDGIKGNTSSAKDLAILTSYIFGNSKSILEKTLQKTASIETIKGGRDYVAESTNDLLSEDLGVEILGGKTGETPQAMKNLALIFTVPNVSGYFVSVVLNSDDNFADTKKIIEAIEMQSVASSTNPL